MVLGIAPAAIIDRQLPFEYTITSRSTDVVVMAHPIQNINHSTFRSMFEREKLSGNNFNDWFRQLKLVLRVEKKMFVIESLFPLLLQLILQQMRWRNGMQYMMHIMRCLILFVKQAGLRDERICRSTRTSWLCVTQDLTVGLILNGLTIDFAGFVRNYNMHNMGKTIGKLHAMLIERLCSLEELCHVYLAELLKKKKQVGTASSLEARKLKQGALYLYVGNDVHCDNRDLIRGSPAVSLGLLLESIGGLRAGKVTIRVSKQAGAKVNFVFLTLCDRNAEESWALLEDLTLYDNKSWNDPRDFAKPVKAITLPQDVLSTSDRRLIGLENQVQRLMEAHLAPMQPTQVNKVTTSCKICSGPPDTQYRMEDHEQAFVEYVITDRIAGTLPRDTVKNPKLSTFLVLSARSYLTEDPQCSTHVHSSINAITICPKQPNEPQNDEPEEKERGREGNPEDTNTMAHNEEQRDTPQLELKDTTTIDNLGPNRNDDGIEWLDVKEPLDLVDTRLGRDMYVFVGNMSYVMDFIILESIENNIDPSLLNMVFGRPFVEIACLAINRKYGLITFTDGIKEITFKTPYKDPERSELSSEGHDLLSSRLILSEDDYDRGCRKPSDLEDGFL
ncbi:hypothetical protein Tco_1093143 [Tanacetum coccineum]|uniref:MAK10-like protein n=1 Tax=Tanacetum coccineum TaxID=301880 RepID=A0ABQ5IBX5_9ASTR